MDRTVRVAWKNFGTSDLYSEIKRIQNITSLKKKKNMVSSLILHASHLKVLSIRRCSFIRKVKSTCTSALTFRSLVHEEHTLNAKISY